MGTNAAVPARRWYSCTRPPQEARPRYPDGRKPHQVTEGATLCNGGRTGRGRENGLGMRVSQPPATLGNTPLLTCNEQVSGSGLFVGSSLSRLFKPDARVRASLQPTGSGFLISLCLPGAMASRSTHYCHPTRNTSELEGLGLEQSRLFFIPSLSLSFRKQHLLGSWVIRGDIPLS